ncbi:MAG TPA: peptidoglycan-binding domain-containing protein [Methylovirgula sp.]
MREALARSDHDFVVSEPRRRKPATRRTILARIGTIIQFGCRIAAYPNRIAGALIFALTLAIVVNALMLQHSRHPAPLFHRAISLPVHAAPARALAVSGETAKTGHDPIGQWLGGRAPASSEHASAEKAKAEPHRHAHEGLAETETKPVTHDSIGQLLKSDSAHDAAPKEQSKTVLAVQHALVKLGFVVRPDGQMGAVTRHALEQFERDHRLPVDGQITPKLLHRLSAETGMSME